MPGWKLLWFLFGNLPVTHMATGIGHEAVCCLFFVLLIWLFLQPDGVLKEVDFSTELDPQGQSITSTFVACFSS